MIIFMSIIHISVISYSSVLGKPTCKYGEFVTKDMFGNKSCVACQKCPVGFGLAPQCGSTINYGDRFKCEPCKLGVSYSTKNDISSCKPCGICTNHMTTISKCTPTRNSKCGKSCERGFYYSQVTFDCQECSWCCKESDLSPIKACEVPGVPFYKQCSADDGLFCQPRCTDKQFVVVNKALNRTCLECPNCPKGKGLQPKCSSVLTNQNEAKCSTCIPGKTFSDVVDPSSCKPCSACEVGKKIERVCNATHDTLCGDCTHGFYDEKQADGKINCKECSFCCGDKLDVRVAECKAQGMPTNQQCAYTERAVRKCKHSQSEHSYNLIIIILSVLFAIAMAVVIVGLCYHFKIRRINYKPLEEVESCESMIGVTPFVAKERPSPSSTPDLITFTKSGVKIECADPDVGKSILDMVSVEVCTGTSNSNLFPKLKENEVLLSPVIKLHNGGYNLHHPVRLNLFHSALVEGEEIENWSIIVLKSNKSDENYSSSDWTNLTNLKDIVVERGWVEFSENDFTSYVMVGIPGQDKKLSKKRMCCAVFGNSEPRIGIPYSINLYLIDDCEPSYEKLIVEEENQGRRPMASLRSLHPDIHPKSKITVSIEVASEGWTTYQPKTFHSRDWLESYKKVPKVEAIFEHQDQFQNDFKCSFIIKLNDATVVQLPVMQYFASYCSQVTAGGIQESLNVNTSQDSQEHEAANRATGPTSFTDDEINKALQSIDIDKLNAFTHKLFPDITDHEIELMKTSADPMVSLSDMVKRQKITCEEIDSAVKHCQGNNQLPGINQSVEDMQLPYLGETNPVVI